MNAGDIWKALWNHNCWIQNSDLDPIKDGQNVLSESLNKLNYIDHILVILHYINLSQVKNQLSA